MDSDSNLNNNSSSLEEHNQSEQQETNFDHENSSSYTYTKPIHYRPKKTENFVNKNVNAESLDFNSMTKEELIAQGKRLQSHVFQLKNLLKKARNVENNTENDKNKKQQYKRKSTRADKQFDFKKFNKRHVLIKFAYLGWNYHVRIFCKLC
jgi:hypothetical protein